MLSKLSYKWFLLRNCFCYGIYLYITNAQLISEHILKNINSTVIVTCISSQNNHVYLLRILNIFMIKLVNKLFLYEKLNMLDIMLIK